MNTRTRFCVVSTSIALALSPVANASLSKGHSEATLDSLSSSLTITRVQRWGGIHAWDSTHDEESWAESETTDVSGQVDIGSAKGKMWTNNLFVAVESLATPTNGGSTAAGGANQRWWFTAGETGTVTFTANYSVQQELQTTLPGEWAWVAGGCFLDLYDSDWNLIDFVYSSWHLNWNSGSWSYSGPLSLSHDFNKDDQAFLWFHVESQGGANTVVPVPGAMVLGSLGMSFASWLLYRRKRP